MRRSALVALIVATFACAWVAPVLPWFTDVSEGPVDANTLARVRGPALSPPAMAWDVETGGFRFGRYDRPVRSTFIPGLSPWDRAAADKAFVWVGCAAGELHISMALLQFNYAAAAVFSVFDAATGRSWSLYRDLPGPLAPLFGPRFGGGQSVASGCVTQRDWAGNASVCYDDASESVFVNASVPLRLDAPSALTRSLYGADSASAAPFATMDLSYAVDIGAGTFPTMVFPLGPRRPVTVSKFAARPVRSGRVVLNAPSSGKAAAPSKVVEKDLSGALAATDFTRGLLRRETVWKWLSLSAMARPPMAASAKAAPAPAPYGLHLSTGTYDFGPSGASSESSIFFRDAAGEPAFDFFDAANVTFTQLDTAKPKTESRWHVAGPGGLDLTFTPHGGTFHGDIHLGVIDCDLWHMWGTFRGRAPARGPAGSTDAVVELDGAPGVLEDHYSLW